MHYAPCRCVFTQLPISVSITVCLDHKFSIIGVIWPIRITSYNCFIHHDELGNEEKTVKYYFQSFSAQDIKSGQNFSLNLAHTKVMFRYKLINM